MIINSIWLSFTLSILCILVASESIETFGETPLKRCAQVHKKLRPRFHLVRRCARSDARVVISANLSSLGRCIEFATYKRGLAVNFGWLKGNFRQVPTDEQHPSLHFHTSGVGHCEVLECPEHDTLGFLRRRENFDYYSLYANPLPSMDWVCVPKVGMFRIGRREARAASLRKCQEWALMPTPQNKTEGEKGTGSSTPGGHTATATSFATGTARPEEHFTQESQPSNFPFSPASPFPSSPPLPPSFENGSFGPPLLPPAFPGNLEDFPLWDPEYRLGDSIKTDNSNTTDTKTKKAGQLAIVLSQERTTNITNFLKSKLGKFFPPVLVGMATVPGEETLFATSDDEPLPCFRFRAWAPGHPLPSKKLNAILRQRSSTAKPSSTQVRTNVTASSNTTTTNTTQMSKNETSNNNGTINITTSAVERKRNEMTLCVYIQHDSLWHTNLCSTKTPFLCEILPSGGPCSDANSTDERAECEYEKIGTKEDSCSAWNGQMITTTTPPEPENGDGDTNNSSDDDEDNNNSSEDNDEIGEDNDDADEDSNSPNEDEDVKKNTGEQDNNDDNEQNYNNADNEDGDYNDFGDLPGEESEAHNKNHYGTE